MQISIKCNFDQQCCACHMHATIEPVRRDEMPVTSQAAGRQRRRPRQLPFFLFSDKSNCSVTRKLRTVLLSLSGVPSEKREP